MAHVPIRQRDRSLFSLSITSPRRSNCSLKVESSSRLIQQRGSTNTGNVFPYSFSCSSRCEPVTREMKQRAGEILSDALPSDSSGEERNETGWSSTRVAESRQENARTRTRVRPEPYPDDEDSRPTGGDHAVSSSASPRDAQSGRHYGRSLRRPPVLSKLRGKLQETTIHRATARGWRHSSTEADNSTPPRSVAKQRKAGNSFPAANTTATNREALCRQRTREQLPRRTLLFDQTFSQRSASSAGSDSERRSQQCDTYLGTRDNYFVSPTPVLSGRGYSSKDSSSTRRRRPRHSTFVAFTDRGSTDTKSGIIDDVAYYTSHQEQKLPVGCQRELWPFHQQRQGHRSLSQKRNFCDRDQQQRHYQQYTGVSPSIFPFLCEGDNYEKEPNKHSAKTECSGRAPHGGSAESVSRVLVDVSVIRTIVHEAAALRIAWSVQNLLRKPVGNAVSVLRYPAAVPTPLNRIALHKQRKNLKYDKAEQALLQRGNATSVSTEATNVSTITTVQPSGRELWTESNATTHKLPDHFVSRPCSRRGSGISATATFPGGCGETMCKAVDLHMAATRLLVHELTGLLVRPRVRLAWNKLARLQEELRTETTGWKENGTGITIVRESLVICIELDLSRVQAPLDPLSSVTYVLQLSRYVCPLYKSLKVTSRWAATFTRATAAKIILQVTAVALQRSTLRVLFLLQAVKHVPDRKTPSAACCAEELDFEGEEKARMQGAAQPFGQEDRGRRTKPSSVVRGCGTPVSALPQRVCIPVAAADACCSADVEREQTVGSTNHCAEGQLSGRGLAGGGAQREKKPHHAAEIASQPGCTVHQGNLQLIAAVALTPSQEIVNGTNTHVADAGSKISRQRVSEVIETPVPFTESRETGACWGQAVGQSARKSSCRVPIPASGFASVGFRVMQYDHPKGSNEKASGQLVMRRTPSVRYCESILGREISNVSIARISASSSVRVQAISKSMRSASPALAADEAISAPAPFAPDKKAKMRGS